MLNNFEADIRTKILPPRKCMIKKGTLDIDIVEATPVVWQGRV